MLSTASVAMLPGSWAQVLERVEEALHLAEAAVSRREQESARVAVPLPNLPESGAKEQEILEQPNARQQDWQAILDGVAAQAREAEAALVTAEEGFRGWLANAAEQRRKVAEGPGRDI
jgi:hypothetical protein